MMKNHEDKVAAMYVPFTEYVPPVAKLMTGHIWKLARLSGTSADVQMDHAGWLSRLATVDTRVMSDLSALPEWKRARARLVTVMDSCISESQLPAMEDKCLDILLPWFEPRFRAGYVFPERPFHHWWYTLHKENTLVAVHLINADMPRSPFADVKKFGGTLLRAVEDACEKYPGIREVECGTWLNNVPRFLQFWPKSYHDNRQDWQDTGGFGPGWWGQYMTAAGGFSENAAEILRSTGKHRHPLSEGRCPVRDVLTHSKDFLG